jgi:hypothetical protein
MLTCILLQDRSQEVRGPIGNMQCVGCTWTAASILLRRLSAESNWKQLALYLWYQRFMFLFVFRNRPVTFRGKGAFSRWARNCISHKSKPDYFVGHEQSIYIFFKLYQNILADIILFTFIGLFDLCCHSALCSLSNSSVIFLPQLYFVSEFCRTPFIIKLIKHSFLLPLVVRVSVSSSKSGFSV